MKEYLMGRAAVFAALVAVAGTSFGALKGSSFLHAMSGEYVTPHFDYRGSSAQKPLRVLFLLNRAGGRDAVEVVQRFAVEPTYFLMPGGAAIAHENMYESAWVGTTVYEKTCELDEKLNADYDLYVFGKKDFTSVGVEHRYRILKAVQDKGAGLLLVDRATVKSMPYKKVYADALPTPEFVPAFVEKGEKTTVKGYRLGKGRVVELSWKTWRPAPYFALVPAFPVDDLWPAQYESAIAFVGLCMRYAAGCETEPSEQSRIRYRDRFNRETVDASCAGKYWREKIGANGAVEISSVVTPSAVGQLKVEAAETARPGEPVGVRAVWQKASASVATATLETLDSPRQRVMTRTTAAVPAGATDVSFAAADPRVRTKAGYFRVTLNDAAGKSVDVAEAVTFFPKRNTDDFMNLGWDTVLGMHPFAGYPMLIERMGFNLGLTHPSADGSNIREMALLNQDAVIYNWRVCLGTAKNGSSRQDNWNMAGPVATKMHKELTGDECFYRPEVQAIWKEGMAFRVKNLIPYAPAVYSLGDENYLHVEDGFGEEDDRYFREFLKGKYKTIENLNRNWRTNFADFASVPHLKPAEAKRIGNLAAWADHRGYIEKMYADIHAFCRREIQSYDPGAPVGAERSEPGELELTLGDLEYWGPYSSLVEDEVLRSFGGDRIRMLWWGGYPSSHGGRGASPFPVPLMQDLTKGTVMGSAWFAVNVGQNHGMFHSDLTLADDVRDYLFWHDLYKDGLAQLLVRNPLKDEKTLLYWSHPSSTAAHGSEKCLSPRDGLTVLIHSFYRTGRSFEFVSARTLGRLADAKTLFLCGATALSDAEVAAIRAFAEKGGTVVADVEPALMNENLCWRDKPALADLWGKGNATLLGGKLSQRQARGKKDGAFDREIARFLPARTTYGTTEPASDSAILRTRKGPDFDLLTAFWPVGQIGVKRTVSLGKTKHVYSPISGFVGKSDKATLDFTSAPIACLAFFDAPQQAPTLSVGPAKLGGEVKATVPALVSGRVYNLTVKDPDGQIRWRFVFDRAEKAPKDMFVAYTDKPGRWSAVLTDVATGLKNEAAFEVTK